MLGNLSNATQMCGFWFWFLISISSLGVGVVHRQVRPYFWSVYFDSCFGKWNLLKILCLFYT